MRAAALACALLLALAGVPSEAAELLAGAGASEQALTDALERVRGSSRVTT